MNKSCTRHRFDCSTYITSNILPGSADITAINWAPPVFRLIDGELVIDESRSVTIIDGDVFGGITFAEFTFSARAEISGNVFGDASFDRISDDSTALVSGNVFGNVVFDDSWNSLAQVARQITGGVEMFDVRDSAVEAISAAGFYAQDSSNIKFDFSGFVPVIHLDDVNGAEGSVGFTLDLRVSGGGNDLDGEFAGQIGSDGDNNSFDFSVVHNFNAEGDDLVAVIDRLIEDAEIDEGSNQILTINAAEINSLGGVPSIFIGGDSEGAKVTVLNGAVEVGDEGERSQIALGDQGDFLKAAGIDGSYRLGDGNDFAVSSSRFGTNVLNGEGGEDDFFVFNDGDTAIFGGEGFDRVEYDTREGGDHYAANIEQFSFQLAPGVFIDNLEQLDFATTGETDGQIEFGTQDGDTFRLTVADSGDNFVFG